MWFIKFETMINITQKYNWKMLGDMTLCLDCGFVSPDTMQGTYYAVCCLILAGYLLHFNTEDGDSPLR
jgi:hypothetical protein